MCCTGRDVCIGTSKRIRMKNVLDSWNLVRRRLTARSKSRRGRRSAQQSGLGAPSRLDPTPLVRCMPVPDKTAGKPLLASPCIGQVQGEVHQTPLSCLSAKAPQILPFFASRAIAGQCRMSPRVESARSKRVVKGEWGSTRQRKLLSAAGQRARCHNSYPILSWRDPQPPMH